MNTDKGNTPVTTTDSEKEIFDHRDPDGHIRKGVQKLLKDHANEDDLLILSYLQQGN